MEGDHDRRDGERKIIPLEAVEAEHKEAEAGVAEPGGPGGPWPPQKFEWVGQSMFWPPPKILTTGPPKMGGQ